MANFCSQCGVKVSAADRFCSRCGANLRRGDGAYDPPSASRPSLPDIAAPSTPVDAARSTAAGPTSEQEAPCGRGPALTIYLGLLFAVWGGLGAAALYLAVVAPRGQMTPPLLMFGASAVMLVFTTGAWKGRRWGAYGVGVCYGAGSLVFLVLGSIAESLTAAALAGIGGWLFTSRWDSFTHTRQLGEPNDQWSAEEWLWLVAAFVVIGVIAYFASA